MTILQNTGYQSFVGDAGGQPKPSWAAWCFYALLSLGLYLGSAGIGLEMAHWEESAPLIWPPAGIGLVMVLRGGWRYLWVVGVGAFSIRYAASGEVLSGLFFGAAYVLSVFVATYFLVKVARFEPSMERLVDVLAFVSGAVVIAPLISSGLTTLALSGTYSSSFSSLLELFAVRWLSDALGILVIAPITLVWYSETRINWRNTQAIEILVWLALLIFLGAMIFRNWAPTDTLRYPLELTMFPLMAWAAIRFGQKGATTGILIVSMMAVWELRDVIGPDATNTITQPPGYLWLFVGVLASTSLFLAAVLAEQKNREDEVRGNEERLRALIEAMPDLSFLVSESARVLDVFVPKGNFYVERAASIRGKTLAEIYPRNLAGEFMSLIAEVLDQDDVRVHRYSLAYEGERRWFEARVAPLKPIHGQPRSVIWVAYDITASHNAIEALQDRDRVLQALTEAESAMLRSTDYVRGRRESISLLGKGLSLDLLVLFQYRNGDGEGEYKLFESWRPDAVGEVPQGKLPETLDPGWIGEKGLEELQRGKPYTVDRLDQLPTEARTCFRSCLVERLLWLPIYSADRFWGIALFARKAATQTWKESDRVLLTSYTNSLGGFLASQQIEEALVLAKHQADAANSAKSEFLAMMSHEIRTPMNAIIGFADILAQSKLEKEQADYLKIINRSGRDLLELINNILDFSKLESAPVELEEVPFRIETTVMEVLEIMLMKARQKGVNLRYEIDDPTDGIYLGDPMRTRQIILNLVSNAVKFTEQGSVSVLVKSRPGPDGYYLLHFAVVDTGIGIPEHAISRLFQAFTQVDSSTTREYGGTGLGLTICKRLAESMQGRVWVESQVGEGSTFHVEVRLKSTDDKSLQESNRSEDDRLDPDYAQAYPLRILLAEDDAINSRLALEILQRLGYEPDHAADGAAAIRLFTEREYDLAILDVQMAHVDGIELTRMLRSGKFGAARQNNYVIALSAMTRSIDENNCIRAGANAFLAKPFTLSDFKAALRLAHSFSIKKEEH